MRDELAEGDAADVVAVEFGDVFDDRVVQPQFAAQRSERNQRSLEYLAYRGDIEQRIRRDRPFRRLISEAIVEEPYLARDVDRHREAPGIVGRRPGPKIACDDGF